MLYLSCQWMGSGPRGAAGVPAPCPVEEAAGREHATAQTQPHSSGATNVKEMTCKLIFATVILVQVSALGQAACPLTGFVCMHERKEALHKSHTPTEIRGSEHRQVVLAAWQECKHLFISQRDWDILNINC